VLANTTFGILLERFIRFRGRLRLFSSVPTALLSFFFAF
jgi:hypothetical protein